MNPRLKMMAALASLVLVAIALRCLWLWQPERQLLLHQQHFRAAMEARKWSKVSAMMDPEYSDRWNYTRTTGVAEARQWVGQYFALTITPQQQSDTFDATGGTVTERWTLEGTGTELAGMVTEHVNAVQSPFVFTWKHGSWEPWDWTLTRVDNAEMNLTDPGM